MKALVLLAGAAVSVPDLPVVKLTPEGPGAMEGVVLEEDEPAPPPPPVGRSTPAPRPKARRGAPKPNAPKASAKGSAPSGSKPVVSTRPRETAIPSPRAPLAGSPASAVAARPDAHAGRALVAAESTPVRLAMMAPPPIPSRTPAPQPATLARPEELSLSLSLVAVRKSGAWPKGVELTPDGSLAITSDFASNTLTLVSTTSLEVVGTVRTGKDSPVEIVFLPDGSTAVITGGYERDRVLVFDIPSRTVTRTIPGSKNRKFPKVAALSPDGSEVWVSYWASNTVGVLDAGTLEPIATIPVGRNPRGIAFTPDGKKAYVCNFCNACPEPSSVHVLDVATRKRRKVIAGVKQPRHVVVSPDGSAAWVSVLGERKVVKIDTATDRIVGAVRVGNRPKTLKLTPDGRHLFVANYGSDTVQAIDTQSLEVVATVKAGDEPSGLSLSADGRRLWTTDWADGTIRVYDVTYPVIGPPLPPSAPDVAALSSP